MRRDREGGPNGKRPVGEKAVGSLVLVVGAAVAGSAAQGAGLPAAWLVGPMLFAAVFALWRPAPRPDVPRWARQAALGVVGGVLAGVFRPSILPLIAKEWPAVGLAVGGTLVLSLAAAALLSRFARLDRRTAVLGTLPLPLSQVSEHLLVERAVQFPRLHRVPGRGIRRARRPWSFHPGGPDRRKGGLPAGLGFLSGR